MTSEVVRDTFGEHGSGQVGERRAAVVVAAGGAGRRMGGVRKQYLELLGEPILVHSLRPFLAHPEIGWVVVAIPPEDVKDPPEWLTGLDPRIVVVAGGPERGDSVRLALEAVPEEAEVVLVHDAARPLVDRETIDRVLAAAFGGVGAVAAVPLADTLKEVDAAGRITATPDRRRFWRAQTPQGFPRRLLLDAARRAAEEGYVATDDAALVEHYGGEVIVVEGSAENFKVTTPADLVVAESILRSRPTPAARESVGRAPDRLAEPTPAAVGVAEDVRRGDEARVARRAPVVVIPFRSSAEQDREGRKVASHLRAGGLIAYPTETVYGLGSAVQPEALERLAALKGRDPNSPFLLLIEGPEQLPELAWTESALRLAAAFWPGPLTLALVAPTGRFPDRVLGPGGTVAVRSSPHPAVRAILAAFGEPITSTSANMSGARPARGASGAVAVAEQMGAPTDLWVIDGGTLPPSPPSTIVDCSGQRPRVVREGAISVTTLAGAIGYIDVGPRT